MIGTHESTEVICMWHVSCAGELPLSTFKCPAGLRRLQIVRVHRRKIILKADWSPIHLIWAGHLGTKSKIVERWNATHLKKVTLQELSETPMSSASEW